MKLKSSNYFFCLLIIFIFSTPLKSEDKIDIWKNDNNTQEASEEKKLKNAKDFQNSNFSSSKNIEINNKNFIKILKNELPIFGCLLYLSCILYGFI